MLHNLEFKLRGRFGFCKYAFVVFVCLAFCVGGLFSFAQSSTLVAAAQSESQTQDVDLQEFNSFSNSLKDMYKFQNQQNGAAEIKAVQGSVLEGNAQENQKSAQSAGKTNALQENEQIEDCTNRLIVSYGGKVDDFGAVAKAEYADWHIFQYENYQDASAAFESLKNSHFQVEFDQKVHIDDAPQSYSSTRTQQQLSVQEIASQKDAQSVLSSKVAKLSTSPSASSTGSSSASAAATTSSSAIYSHHSWGAKYLDYAEYSSTLLKLNGNDVANLNPVVVATIDSGIYREHEIFKNQTRLLLGQYAQNFSDEFVPSAAYEYRDYNGHGTHVAGTIAEGTLDNVKILPLKSMDGNGDGYVSSIVNAMEYAITLKVSKLVDIRAINMSVGVTYEDGSSGENTVVTNAVNKAYDVGIIIVASAGNDCVDVKYCAPASVAKAFSISALAENATFSETPMTFAHSYSNYGEGIDFSAPGSDVESSFIPCHDNGYDENGYATYSGTSMASPHVVATIGLLLSDPANAHASVDDVYNILKEQALKYYDFGAPGHDVYYGWGCVTLKNYGVTHKGQVSIQKIQKQGAGDDFEIVLSYSESFSDDYDVQIYYTDQEKALLVDEFSGKLYSQPVKFDYTETVKITAAAYVYDRAGNLVQKSFVNSEIFYIDDMDLLSNYQFSIDSFGVVYMSSYLGTLETVRVPAEVRTVDGTRYIVTQVGSNCFAGTQVKNVILSECVTSVSYSAFKNNQTIETISGGNAQIGVSLGSYAFYNCKNLKSVNIAKILHVNSYCFSYDDNLSGEIDLQNLVRDSDRSDVITVGLNAFSSCGYEKIVFGNHDNLQIAEQRNINPSTTILGYAGTEAQNFAYRNGLDFVDLTIHFTKDLSDKASVVLGENLETTVAFYGKDVKCSARLRTFDEQILRELTPDELQEQKIGEFETRLTLSVKNLTQNCLLEVILEDNLGQQTRPVLSNAMEIQVISPSQQDNFAKLSFSADLQSAENGDFQVLVDGKSVENGALIEKNRPYTFTFKASNGYCVKCVQINDVQHDNLTLSDTFEVPEQEFTGSSIEIVVTIAEKAQLDVSFTAQKGTGSIIVDGKTLQFGEKTQVSRGGKLTFSVVPDNGYEVDYVEADGKKLQAQVGQVFVVENVTTNISIVVHYRSGSYNLSIVIGMGGTVSSTGVGVDSKLIYGETRTFEIATYEGYVVDYVMVNGEIVDVKDNSFVLENVDRDYEVLIMFRKIDKSLFGNRVLMNYVIVFVTLFGVFLVAKVVLMLVRKQQKKHEQTK